MGDISVSNDSTSTGTIDVGRALLSSAFLDVCSKVRNNDPSILPEVGEPFKIRHMAEREFLELADALLENTSITYLQLETAVYKKRTAEAMAKYLRTSKHLHRIRWLKSSDDRLLKLHEALLCCFLPALQESTSLLELHITFPPGGGPSSLAFENMLTHTHSLQSLILSCQDGLQGDLAMAAVRCGLKNNTTLRELTLEFSRGTSISPILTSLRDHPRLRRLCLHGNLADLSGLETLLLSETSKITELDIHGIYTCPPGLTRVLQALKRHPTLTMLNLRWFPLGCQEARLLQMAFCNTPSLQSLNLAKNSLGSAGLAELAPALYRNTSIKVLDLSWNRLDDLKSARFLRNIIRGNKTMTTLGLTGNSFGQMTNAVEYFVDGLGSNSTLLKINFTRCDLGDRGVSILGQFLGSRNTRLQKLTLDNNSISSTGVNVLLEAMEQSSHHITDLDLRTNPIGNEGASLLARSLENNTLPNLKRLSLFNCVIGVDGFVMLLSALEQNTSLLHLDLRDNHPTGVSVGGLCYHGVSERAFLAWAESLPQIEVLQRLDLSWSSGLLSAMPLLLAGLRKNTSLFRFHVADCAPNSIPPTTGDKAREAGGWKQEMEHLGYRNRYRERFLAFIHTPEEARRPRGLLSQALSRVTPFPDVIFEVLRSQTQLGIF
jgi:Ran GTPase-activating protein (RanGAP) involved in mRNA processing and transport